MDLPYIYASPSEWTAYHDDPADLLAESAESACITNWTTAWITNE